MKRLVDRLVPVLVVLAPSFLVAACEDEMPVAPEKPPVEAAVSVAAVDAAAVHQAADRPGTFTDVLDDPFVHLLIGSLNNPAAAHTIRASLTAASRELSAYKPVSARLAFASARSEIEVYADDREADADDVVTLAALRLIFGHAEKLAVQETDEGATPQGEAEEPGMPDQKPRRRLER